MLYMDDTSWYEKVSKNFVICLIMGHFFHLLSCNRDIDYLLPIYLDFFK